MEPRTLTWKGHRDMFFSQVEVLLKNQAFTDTILICGEKRVAVHRLILVTQSDFFKTHFAEYPDEQEMDVSYLHPENLDQLIAYMYAGEIILDQSQWEGFKEAASLIKLTGFDQEPEIPKGKNPRKAGSQKRKFEEEIHILQDCLLYTSPSPRDRQKSRMPSSA